MRRRLILAAVVVVCFATPASAQEPPAADPERGTLDGSPLDDLPDHIEVLTDFGMRPDWSPNGKQIVFTDGSPLGHVWIADVASGKTRSVNEHFENRGFTRAYFLGNGDLLLCGPTSGPEPTAERPEAGRFSGVMSVLRAPFRGEPQLLGVSCWEGMSTSKRNLRVTWNRSDIDYTDSDLADRVVNGISEIWTGKIAYRRGRAQLVDVERVIDRTAVSAVAVLETQGFRGKNDRELVFTAYAVAGGEVFGVDRESGKVRNYSNSPVYEEAEGVSPDGKYVLVERDLESSAIPGALDIWRLPLDGSGEWERLTHFNRYRGGYYASNPTVSPNGRTIAFQLSIDGPTEGQGNGILLFDLSAFEAAGE